MSFFNKALASIGIGAATVDTKLVNDRLVPGEEVKGIVEIKGGSTEQQIDTIYLSLVTTYIKESNDTKVQKQATIESIKLVDPFTIGPNEKKEFPFHFVLPYETPVTMGNTKVWIQTGLDIKNAVDPSDRDFIDVMPSTIISAVLKAATDIGFRLRKVECEAAPYRLKTRQPFVQEFELVPTSGAYRGRLDEIEFMFLNQTDNQVDVWMQVDRKARGLGSFLSEALEMDESHVNFTVTKQDLPNMEQKLMSIIQKYS
ncbi:sporulation protein [Sutcliffiella sp. NPDC057660]|uniref:sporulation protein n=1 Tax=Sutcliffiella sp. NPDC057660 TaxID=3346199 RepID=UPI003691835E